MKEDDILAFLDKKFSNVVKQSSHNKKEKKKAKKQSKSLDQK